ncbi:MAG: ABC transporter ATP-binding protein [Candidatus Cloacimonadaceae bacterium]
MIIVKNLSYSYSESPVLQEISLELPASGFSVLVGPNGAGKSTLLYLLMGYLLPKTGKISLYNKDIKQYRPQELAAEIAFIPQESHSEFDYLVKDTVLMGRYPYLGLWQPYGKEDEESVAKALEMMQLNDLKERYLSELSGGEKQRVYLARALAQNTKYILLDESLSQLDINFQVEIIRLLKELSTAQGKAIVLVSHNLNLAANYADKMILLKQGRLIANGTPNEVMQEALLAKLFDLPLMVQRNPISGVNNLIYP